MSRETFNKLCSDCRLLTEDETKEAIRLMSRDKQFDIFGNLVIDKPKPIIDKQKRNWENRFQRWSNNQFHKGRTGYGACGYGSICDYCEDMSYGRPCVRALNKMLRDNKIVLDYAKATFEGVWDGKFKVRKAD